MQSIHYQCLIVLLTAVLTSQLGFADDVGTSQQPILNGSAVPVGELEAVGRLPGCTATLIENDLVLTAAHCVCTGESSNTGCRKQTTYTLTNVRPLDNPVTSADESTTRRNITITGDVSVHPKYTSAGWLSYDFATVKLNQSVSSVALGVNPIPLELPTQRPKLNDNLTIVGFGTASPCTATSTPPNDGKQKVTLPLHEISTGNVTLRIGTNGAGACPGDSGGPALNTAGNIVGVASSLPGNYDPTDQAYQWIYPDTFTVKANGVQGSHFENRDQHQFNLVSVYPLTVKGVLRYEWDNVRDSGQSGFIRRLNVLNQSKFPVTFRRLVSPVSLDDVDHTVEKDETASVKAKGKHGFHFEMKDKHQFYLESVYPTTLNGRITYEWNNVRDPGSSRFIRRLTVTNKSNFAVTFKIKILKLKLSDMPVSNMAEFTNSQKLNKTASVRAKGKHGFHFERRDKHQFYLESVYPTTVNGQITYKWDNVRDPGNSGFIRRLTVFNQSNFPVTFKANVQSVNLRNKPTMFSP